MSGSHLGSRSSVLFLLRWFFLWLLMWTEVFTETQLKVLLWTLENSILELNRFNVDVVSLHLQHEEKSKHCDYCC